MKIRKITTGFVVQVYDDETKSWESQRFVSGDDVDWETDANGVEKVLDPDELFDGQEPYLPFEMKQPEQMKTEGWEL